MYGQATTTGISLSMAESRLNNVTLVPMKASIERENRLVQLNTVYSGSATCCIPLLEQPQNGICRQMPSPALPIDVHIVKRLLLRHQCRKTATTPCWCAMQLHADYIDPGK